MASRLHVHVLQGVDMAYKQADFPVQTIQQQSIREGSSAEKRSAKSAWKRGLALARKFVERSTTYLDEKGNEEESGHENASAHSKETTSEQFSKKLPIGTLLPEFGEKEEDRFPVVSLKLGNQIFKTRPAPTVSGGHFDQEFVFSVNESLLAGDGDDEDLPSLELTCEEGSTGRFLGQARIPVARLPERHSIEQWYQMAPAPYGNSCQLVRGAIQLRITFDAETLRSTPALVASTANKLPVLPHRQAFDDPEKEQQLLDVAASMMPAISGDQEAHAQSGPSSKPDPMGQDLECRLVDYMVVVGTSSSVDPGFQGPIDVTPELRYRYPAVDFADLALPTKVEWFCFPNGIKLVRRGLHDPLPPEPVFQEFSNSPLGSKVYGYSMVFYELLCIEQLPTGQVNTYAPACITFITRLPMRDTFRKLLEQYLLLSVLSELAEGRGLSPQLVDAVPPLPTLDQVTLLLTREAPLAIPGAMDVEIDLLSTKSTAHNADSQAVSGPEVAAKIRRFLDLYESQVVNSSPTSHAAANQETAALRRSDSAGSLHASPGTQSRPHAPAGMQERQRVPSEVAISLQTLRQLTESVAPVTYSSSRIGDFPPMSGSVFQLLQYVGANLLIDIWTAALLEYRILIHAKHQPLLSLMGEAIVALLYPLRWQSAIIPVLPEQLVEYVQAPMSYLFGIHSDYMEVLDVDDLAEVVVVDMNQAKLTYLGADPTGVQTPPIPNKVRTKLLRILRQLAARDQQLLGLVEPSAQLEFLETAPPPPSAAECAALDTRVRLAFLDAMVHILHGYRESLFFLNDELPVFNKARFLAEREEQQAMHERGEIHGGEDGTRKQLQRRTSAAHNEGELFLVRLLDSQAFEYFKETQASRRLALFHQYYEALSQKRQERLRQATVAAALRSTSVVKDQRIRVAAGDTVLSDAAAASLADMHTRRKYQLDRNCQVWRSRQLRSTCGNSPRISQAGLVKVDFSRFIDQPSRRHGKSPARFRVPVLARGHPMVLDAAAALVTSRTCQERGSVEQQIKDDIEDGQSSGEYAGLAIRRGRSFSNPGPSTQHLIDAGPVKSPARTRHSGSVDTPTFAYHPAWEDFLVDHAHEFLPKRRSSAVLAGALALDFVRPRSWPAQQVGRELGIQADWLRHALLEQRAVILASHLVEPEVDGSGWAGREPGDGEGRELERSIRDTLTKIFFDESVEENGPKICARAFEQNHYRDLFTLTLRQSHSTHQRHYLPLASPFAGESPPASPKGRSPKSPPASPKGRSPKGTHKQLGSPRTAGRKSQRNPRNPSGKSATPWRSASSAFSGVSGWSFHGDGRVLGADAFDSLVQISRQYLDICARKEDYRNARLLLQVSVAYIKTVQPGPGASSRKVDLRNGLVGVSLWKSLLFWEHVVAEALAHEKSEFARWWKSTHTSSLTAGSENQEATEMDSKTFQEVVFELLTNICSAMIHVGVGEDMAHVLVTRVSSLYEIEDTQEAILHKLVSNVHRSYLASN